MRTVIIHAVFLALFLYPLHATGAAQTKPAAKQTTLTGCLQTSDEADEYALTNDDGKEYRLFGSKTANLAPHIGHKITVIATPVKERKEAKGEHHEEYSAQRGKGAHRPHFEVSKVQMLSKSCK